MKKPHVLFVTERYADFSPGMPSNSHHNLFGSLECSGLANYSNFFLEDNLQNLDHNLKTYHRRISPDLTIVTILPTPNFINNPTNKTFAELSAKNPVVFVWFDSVMTYIMDKAYSLLPCAALHVILDNSFFVPHEKFVHLWTPQDTKIYNDPNLPRDIDISFVGSMNGYLDRAEHMNHLMANLDAYVHRDGGQRERNLSPEDYANVMKRSKISLSFSKNRGGSHQTKGRIFEVTSCGALLMEDVNQGTHLWLEPYKDYVPFTSKEDLVSKAEFYIKQPNKLLDIAMSGKRKTETHYTPKNWWKTIFEKCGVLSGPATSA